MGLVIIFFNLTEDGVHSYYSKPFYSVDEAEDFYNKNIITEECNNTESIINLDTYMFAIDEEEDKVRYYNPYCSKNVFDEIRKEFY